MNVCPYCKKPKKEKRVTCGRAYCVKENRKKYARKAPEGIYKTPYTNFEEYTKQCQRSAERNA